MDSDDDHDLELSEFKEKATLVSDLCPNSRSTAYLISLTIGLGGLQAIFALIFSNGSAFLSGLGLNKPSLSLVWMVGPFCGMILQPYFGIRSDDCHSRWGKRRPFIFFGSLAAVTSLLGLASTERLARDMNRHLGLSDDSSVQQTSAVIAVFCVSSLNIAIQALQGGLRALIIDTVPKHQQQAANAWAGASTSTMNLLCYFLSSLDLTQSLSFLGNSQFSILCVITSLLLSVAVAITCVAVKEKVTITHQSCKSPTGIITTLRQLFISLPRLSQIVQAVLKVQFFSWMGWFPFLYYITIYIESFCTSAGNSIVPVLTYTATSHNPERTMRNGSLGLIIFSLASLLAGTTLPSLIARASYRRRHSQDWCSSSRRVWIASHLLFASCMFATVLATSLWQIHLLVGISGISWGVTIWAPHAIISSHLSECAVDSHANDDCERRPGIIVGLHNAAIAAPQIVAAIGCSILFWLFDGASGSSVGWVLRISALSTLTAAWLAKDVRI